MTHDIFSPRAHQISLSKRVVSILRKSDHAYLESPTATGKTLALGLVADSLPFRNIIYAVNSIDVLEQTKASIEELQSKRIISPDQNWEFMTWRRYASLCARDPSQLLPDHLALVDECHIGGVRRSMTVKRAFPAIVRHSKKRVWVSATPWGLDETVMGRREGYTAFFSYPDAYRAGLLNEADIVRVDCGLDVTFRYVEAPRNLFRRETSLLKVSGLSAEATFDQLSDYIRGIEGRNLRPTDIPALVRYRWMLMAELYWTKHRGKKAIFWLPTKEHARACANYLNSLAPGHKIYADYVLGEVRGSAAAEAASCALDEWQKPNSSIDVICVVQRLREGFDYPALTYGFDCAWNPYNYRSTVQKIGRLIRRDDGKNRSQYYHAVDAVSVAAFQGNFSRKFIRQLETVYESAAIDVSARAISDAASIHEAITEITPTSSPLPTVQKETLRKTEVLLARVPLLEVMSARRSAETKRLDLVDMFTTANLDDVSDYVDKIIRGEEPYPGMYGRTPDSNRLRTYLSPSHPNFRPDLHARLVEAKILLPKEQRQIEANLKLYETIRKLENGLIRFDDKGVKKFLFKYFNYSNKTFRADVRKRLLDIGYIKVTKASPEYIRENDYSNASGGS